MLSYKASMSEKQDAFNKYGEEDWVNVVDISVIIKAMKSHPGFKDSEPDEDEKADMGASFLSESP